MCATCDWTVRGSHVVFMREKAPHAAAAGPNARVGISLYTERATSTQWHEICNSVIMNAVKLLLITMFVMHGVRCHVGS